MCVNCIVDFGFSPSQIERRIQRPSRAGIELWVVGWRDRIRIRKRRHGTHENAMATKDNIRPREGGT